MTKLRKFGLASSIFYVKNMCFSCWLFLSWSWIRRRSFITDIFWPAGPTPPQDHCLCRSAAIVGLPPLQVHRTVAAAIGLLGLCRMSTNYTKVVLHAGKVGGLWLKAYLLECVSPKQDSCCFRYKTSVIKTKWSTAIPWARQSSVPRKCCLAQNYTP